MGHPLQEETVQRKDTEIGSEVRRRSPDTGQQLISLTIVLNFEAGQPHGQPISWQQMGFFDVLAVDQRAVAGIEITNHKRAVDLADLAMDSADPSVIHTNIGLGVSANDNWQFAQDESDLGAAVIEAN